MIFKWVSANSLPMSSNVLMWSWKFTYDNTLYEALVRINVDISSKITEDCVS